MVAAPVLLVCCLKKKKKARQDSASVCVNNVTPIELAADGSEVDLSGQQSSPMMRNPIYELSAWLGWPSRPRALAPSPLRAAPRRPLQSLSFASRVRTVCGSAGVGRWLALVPRAACREQTWAQAGGRKRSASSGRGEVSGRARRVVRP